MTKRKYIFVAVIVPFLAVCQKPYTDIKTYAGKPLVTPSFNQPQTNANAPALLFINPGFLLKYPSFRDFHTQQPIGNNSQRFIFDTNRFTDQSSTGVITRFDNNFIVGSGDFSTLPLIGTIRSANIFYIYTSGKWTVSAGISASKYNLVPGVYNNFGFSGVLNYAVNEKLSFSVFGSYYTNNSFHSAAALPYLSNSRYGASMSMAFDEKIGLTLGAQRYYDPFSGRWITAPIIAPSFKIGKSVLEIDLGGLLRLGLDHLYNNNDRQNHDSRQAAPKTPVLTKRVDMF